MSGSMKGVVRMTNIDKNKIAKEIGKAALSVLISVILKKLPKP